MTKIYEVIAESYGINGENTEGDTYISAVAAKNMMKALQKFRSNQPKSLEYEIITIELAYDNVIL